MQKKELFFCLGLCLIPLAAQAELRPIATLSFGLDTAQVGMNKNISLVPPFINTYTAYNKYDTEKVAGIFLGEELRFQQIWAWQVGIGYYDTQPFAVKGDVYQFGDPAYDNLSYEYHIKSRRILAETKFLTTIEQRYHPYITGGVGEAFNQAYGYNEVPLADYVIPMQPFADHSNQALTYTVGLGVDVDLSAHVRLGAGYRFANLGQVSLGVSPAQQGDVTLNHGQLNTSEFLLQLSYVI